MKRYPIMHARPQTYLAQHIDLKMYNIRIKEALGMMKSENYP